MSSVPPPPDDRAGRPASGDGSGSLPSYGSPAPGSPAPSAPGSYGAPSAHGAPAAQVPGRPAPGTDLGADFGAALRWMWQAFARNVAAFLVPAIVWAVVMTAIVLVCTGIAVAVSIGLVDGNPGTDENPPLGPFLALYGIILASVPFAGLVSVLWQTGAARAATTVREGGRARLGASFVGTRNLFLTALLVAVMVFIGTILLYLPGLILGVLCFYALPAAARGATPGAAIKESFSLVRANLGITVVAYVIMMAASSVLSLMLVGIVVLIPLMVLLQFGLYERLNRRELDGPARI